MSSENNAKYVRSLLVDSGAQITLMRPDAELLMKDPKKSNTIVTSANTGQSLCLTEGLMTIGVLNTPHYPGFAETTDITFHAVTMSPLTKELLSLDDLFRVQGYSLLLRTGDNQQGVCELRREASETQAESRVPLRHDHDDGQFWVDYIPHQYNKRMKHAHHVLLANANQRMINS